jgi:uroporphyrinogen III methyltransferase/synthase
LKEKGIRIDYMPKEYIAEAILEGFEGMAIRGKRILLARARVARDVLPEGLRKAGARVDVVETYRTIKPRGGIKKDNSVRRGIDAVALPLLRRSTTLWNSSKE